MLFSSLKNSCVRWLHGRWEDSECAERAMLQSWCTTRCENRIFHLPRHHSHLTRKATMYTVFLHLFSLNKIAHSTHTHTNYVKILLLFCHLVFVFCHLIYFFFHLIFFTFSVRFSLLRLLLNQISSLFAIHRYLHSTCNMNKKKRKVLFLLYFSSRLHCFFRLLLRIYLCVSWHKHNNNISDVYFNGKISVFIYTIFFPPLPPRYLNVIFSAIHNNTLTGNEWSQRAN